MGDGKGVSLLHALQICSKLMLIAKCFFFCHQFNSKFSRIVIKCYMLKQCYMLEQMTKDQNK